MSEQFQPPVRSWPRRFRDAFAGIRVGIQRQPSFRVHILAALLVVVAAAALRMPLLQWCLLLLCIAGVWTAEMFNSALERLAKAVDARYNPHLEAALNIASAAVLVAALGAAIVGTLLFAARLWEVI